PSGPSVPCSPGGSSISPDSSRSVTVCSISSSRPSTAATASSLACLTSSTAPSVIRQAGTASSSNKDVSRIGSSDSGTSTYFVTLEVTEATEAQYCPGSSHTPSLPSASRRTPSDRKSTRLNSSHVSISYAVFCLKKK